MKTLNNFSKITLLIVIISGALWLGSYIARMFLFYQLFTEIDFALKPYVTYEALPAIFITLNSIIIFTMVCYLIFLPAYLLFIITSKLNLKRNGWLFLITLIVLITAPFELYLITIDYSIIMHILAGTVNPSFVLEQVIDRFKTLSSFPIILILSYFAVIYFMVFQPFTIK